MAALTVPPLLRNLNPDQKQRLDEMFAGNPPKALCAPDFNIISSQVNLGLAIGNIPSQPEGD